MADKHFINSAGWTNGARIKTGDKVIIEDLRDQSLYVGKVDYIVSDNGSDNTPYLLVNGMKFTREDSPLLFAPRPVVRIWEYNENNKGLLYLHQARKRLDNLHVDKISDEHVLAVYRYLRAHCPQAVDVLPKEV